MPVEVLLNDMSTKDSAAPLQSMPRELVIHVTDPAKPPLLQPATSPAIFLSFSFHHRPHLLCSIDSIHPSIEIATCDAVESSVYCL